MGHKSNPIGLRLQINRTWDSRWFAEGHDYGRLLLEDLKIRKYIVETLPQAAISKVVIERPAKLCRVSIYAARPGVIIGKKGSDIEKLRKKLSAMTSGLACNEKRPHMRAPASARHQRRRARNIELQHRLDCFLQVGIADRHARRTQRAARQAEGVHQRFHCAHRAAAAVLAADRGELDQLAEIRAQALVILLLPRRDHRGEQLRAEIALAAHEAVAAEAERGLAIDIDQLFQLNQQRGQLGSMMRQFMGDWDVLITPSHELVTLIEGEGSSAANTRRITEHLADEFPQISVEVHHGGQPLYPYLIGVE